MDFQKYLNQIQEVHACISLDLSTVLRWHSKRSTTNVKNVKEIRTRPAAGSHIVFQPLLPLFLSIIW